MKYRPMYFVQVAFKNYRITVPVQEADWVGVKFFTQLFQSSDFWLAVKNTILIAFYRLVFGFPAPIILAVMINEINKKWFQKITQSLVYLPHFISWVVVGGILKNFLTVQGGVINELFGFLNLGPYGFLIDPKYFQGVLVLSGIWKDVGWGTILYLAAMASINLELYESAQIDGASRLQQIWNITIPGITFVIVTLLIIQVGNMLNQGYEQIFVLYNPAMKSKGLILQYYVYQQGISKYRYSFATAAGLFNSLVAVFLVFSTDPLAKKLGQRGVF
jgi:putative aldouronate transport system permease protein